MKNKDTKATILRKKKPAELQKMLQAETKKMQEFRFTFTGNTNDSMLQRNSRKLIARIKTLLNQANK